MSDTAYIDEPRSCDFIPCERDAEYDFRTVNGPWANGCQEHYERFRASDQLGTGFGQRLVVGEKPAVSRSARGASTLAMLMDELGMPEDEVLMAAEDLGMTELFD